MVDAATAVRALEVNAWSLYSVFGRGDGGSITDTEHRLIIETPVQQPPYNSVMRFYDDGSGPLGRQVAEVAARFAGRDVAELWLAHPTAAPGLGAALTASGYDEVEVLRGMVRPLDGLPAMPDPSGDVEILEPPADEPDQWLELVSWRYQLSPQASPYLAAIHRTRDAERNRVWVARIGGRAVGKAVLHIDGEGVAGIYGVVTTDLGRGRGLGSALTLQALHEARSAGCSLAVLHSTPVARPLYARLGFVEVADFGVWAKPNSLRL